MEAPSPHLTLETVLRGVANQPLVILLSGHPDPDSLGCAVAHQRICKHLGVPATIAHVEPLSLRENRALAKLLDLEMLHVTNGSQLSEFKYLSLVDTVTPHADLDLPPGLQLLTVVDHHQARPDPSVPFADVRPQMGAASSIYAEYLQRGLAPLGAGLGSDSRVATALFFGIQTDTDDFALARSADFQAAAYLRPSCDDDVLKRVGRRTVNAPTMDVLGRALSNLLVVREFAMAGVGYVDPGFRDSIAVAADFLMRREDIDTALVFGVVGDRIDGSLRTNSPGVDPGAFLRAAFGNDPDGRPYGGGRVDKGGFQIPLGFLADVEDRDTLWRLVENLVQSRVAEVVPDLSRNANRNASSSIHPTMVIRTPLAARTA